MVTRIKDIAEALDLSVATVQKVLRDAPGFTETTRQRVFRKAKELHYRPNWLASSLVTRKTHILGVVVPDLSRPFFPMALRGIDRIAYPPGYSLVVFNTEGDWRREEKGIAALLGKQVDGMIIASSQHHSTKRIWEPIRKSGVPFLFIDRFFVGAPYVGADNELVGYMATRHLISEGYQSIAHLCTQRYLVTAFGRFQGYVRALREAGRRVLDAHILEMDGPTDISGYAGTKKLLSLSNPPDAIFATTDSLAIGATQAIRESGFHLPEDFGVIGVGNISYSDHLQTPLSSVDLHPLELGKSAASILLGMINGKSVPKKPVLLDPSLVVRTSSFRSQQTNSPVWQQPVNCEGYMRD
jgi:LacI family transcriptional regulator, galactose operon repressor